MEEYNVSEALRRIEMLIAKNGMSKEEFYELSGISSASFSQWNNGVHKPTKKKLAKAASVLDTTLEYLMYGEEQKEKTPSEEERLKEKQLLLQAVLLDAEMQGDNDDMLIATNRALMSTLTREEQAQLQKYLTAIINSREK